MSRPKIGIALGAGSARGFAHIGVLKALKEADIPVDMIAGSSMGSFVASLYGAGHDMEQLHKLSTAFRRKYFLDFIIPKMGFIAGKKIKSFIRLFTHGKHIEELKIPIAIVATDIKKAEKVVFKTGPIADAVRASIAIPGIFVPEKINGRLLVDGGVIDRVPVSVVKEMGADIVIGVDVSSVKKNAEIQTIFDVIMQSIDILQLEMIANRQNASNVMIRPPVGMYSSKTFTHIEEIITAGEKETQQRIPEILAEMERWKEQLHEK
ncbi:patatin family protein [Bacillus aerolatus]|uniref:Patatin family protein n=1 Tax=Bacillus aerolatus TaxID=2653354 RepID=A0A6I1FT72_9BACI|nr:patatin-like phospholipase family protein [Bacillus aerolatus]KAB7707955.1 patatin family protein [Bacillus aerolatus]